MMKMLRTPDSQFEQQRRGELESRSEYGRQQ